MPRVWALYPSAKHVLPRMRALLDFLADWFRDAKNGSRMAAVGGFAVVRRRRRRTRPRQGAADRRRSSAACRACAARTICGPCA